ncbi:hypothetical protein, partial [Nostocoides sp.]|uniref:hypothetical protein n=1 Tax=Nostocoides sp. TaxID=1917966 RepID=UPI003BAFC5D6
STPPATRAAIIALGAARATGASVPTLAIAATLARRVGSAPLTCFLRAGILGFPGAAAAVRSGLPGAAAARGVFPDRARDVGALWAEDSALGQRAPRAKGPFGSEDGIPRVVLAASAAGPVCMIVRAARAVTPRSLPGELARAVGAREVLRSLEAGCSVVVGELVAEFVNLVIVSIVAHE